MPNCAYKESYGGDCGAKTQMMDRFCAEHLGLPCNVCHGQAYQACSAPGPQGGPCGFPICLTPYCQTQHKKKWHPRS